MQSDKKILGKAADALLDICQMPPHSMCHPTEKFFSFALQVVGSKF